MLEQLLSLFNGENLERLSNLVETQFEKYSLEKDLFANATSFTEVDGHYELTLNVKEGTTEDDIRIDFVDGVVKVKYKEVGFKSERIVTIKETLPLDADDTTLNAVVVDGKLIVSVDKKD